MKSTMSRFAPTFCVLLVLAGVSGCADIVVRSPRYEQSAAYQAAPVDDGRAAERIRDENTSLRATMRDLEQRHNSLASSVQEQDQRKDSLKRQRDLAENDRDRYKKLLKKDD